MSNLNTIKYGFNTRLKRPVSILVTKVSGTDHVKYLFKGFPDFNSHTTRELNMRIKKTLTCLT